jgi:hypothetical protein
MIFFILFSYYLLVDNPFYTMIFENFANDIRAVIGLIPLLVFPMIDGLVHMWLLKSFIGNRFLKISV